MILIAVSDELIASGNCQEHMEEFKRENVAVIALSVDPSEKAKEMIVRVNAAFRLPLAFEFRKTPPGKLLVWIAPSKLRLGHIKLPQ